MILKFADLLRKLSAIALQTSHLSRSGSGGGLPKVKWLFCRDGRLACPPPACSAHRGGSRLSLCIPAVP